MVTAWDPYPESGAGGSFGLSEDLTRCSGDLARCSEDLTRCPGT